MNINQKGAAILRAVHGDNWAMVPERFAALTHIVSDGPPKDDDADWPKMHIQSTGGSGTGEPKILVLPIYGTLTKRRSWYTGTAYDDIGDWIDAAITRGVKTIILDIDSPGGEVAGIIELADTLQNAKDFVRIIAVANPFAASAAYWIGAQASQFYISPSGEAGSIGVWTAHVDMSKALEADGLDVTLISAGKYKTEGNPWEPLSEEARGEMQRGIDYYYGRFLQAVAEGRKTTVSNVQKNYGRGRMMRPADAIRVGMVDGISTLEGVIVGIQRSRRSVAKAKLSIAIAEAGL